MKSIALKAATALAATALISASLSGCAPTPKQVVAITDCEDLSNAQSWSEDWTYHPTKWGLGSKIYPAFGVYKCSEDVSLKVSFTTKGKNFVLGAKYLSLGDKQITVVNSPLPTTKWLKSDSVFGIPSGLTTVKRNQVFQPVVEVLPSTYGVPGGKDPIRAVLTLTAKGKNPVTYVHELQFEVDIRYDTATASGNTSY